MTTTTPATEAKRIQKTRRGTVLRRSGAQSVVVEVQRFELEPVVKKYIRRRGRLHVHDPANRCRVGDVVRIQECRPISRTKRWVLREVITQGTVTEVPAELAGT